MIIGTLSLNNETQNNMRNECNRTPTSLSQSIDPTSIYSNCFIF